MQPIPSPADGDPIDIVLAAHGGDARAAIAGLLEDLDDAHSTIDLAGRAVSYGFTRGWILAGTVETEGGK